MEEKIRKILEENIRIKKIIIKSLSKKIHQAINWINGAFNKGNKIILFGNGGSAADAEHIATEFVSRFKKDRKPLPALSLTTNTSLITGHANDYDFATIFSRQIEVFGKKGDIAIAISTSGNAANAIIGIKMAKKIGLKTIGLLGKGGGRLKDIVDLALIVPSDETPRVQEVHITIGHIICELVEEKQITR